MNGYDPLESYSDWRRLNIPPDLPVSLYPGTTATHIPYRLLYPSSEYHYNAANVGARRDYQSVYIPDFLDELNQNMKEHEI